MNIGENMNRNFNVISDVIARKGIEMKLLFSKRKQEEIKKSGRVFDSSEQTRSKAIVQNSKTRFQIN